MDRQGPSYLTTSGRTAILLGLSVLGVGSGQRVLLPTYHCPTMVEPVVRLGAIPVFYPIGPGGEPDLASLRGLDLQGATAMLAAHFFGLPLDLSPTRAFCDARGLALIEDCAHAFFGSSAAGAVGSLGDIAIASLPKFFPVVEGGCLVVHSPTAARPVLTAPGRIHELRTAWDALELGAAADRLGIAGAAVRALVGLKNRLRGRATPRRGVSPASANTGAQFETIDPARANHRAATFVRWVVASADAKRIVAARRDNYRRFAGAFGEAAGMNPLFPDLPDDAVPYVFPLQVAEPASLYQALRICGVPLYRWDIAWPGTPQASDDVGGRWSTQVLQLACHQDMTASDVDAVAEAVFRERRRTAA